MQTKSILMALSAMALVTACTNDETIEMNRGEGISLSAVAGKATRAGSEATTTNSIDNFHVYAFTQGLEYMNHDVTRTDDTWTYGDTKFWPETDVDFYSYSPMDTQNGSVSIEVKGDKKIVDYNVSGDEDLLYALNLAEKKAEHEGKQPVTVNFRHALSQIVFKIKNTNSNLTVFVDGVKVDGIEKQGTFSWPTLSTTTQWQETEKDTETDDSWGTWGIAYNKENAKQNGYPAEITPIMEPGFTGSKDASVRDLTVKTDNGYKGLLLLPQTLNPWITKTGGTDENPEYKITGTARVLVKCKLVDTASDVQLWPDKDSQEETAWVGVSLVGEPKDISGKTEQVWKQGKRYVYTLIFGEGGGFNPENPDPENPDPEPVLVPITFDVTVDNFVEYPQDLDASVPDSKPGK